MKNIYKIIIGVVLVLVILVVIGQKPVKGVKAGAVLPLTGGLASASEDLRNGMALAIEETGLSVIFQDGEANPQKSLSAARQLVDIDGVAIVMSAFRGASISIASGLSNSDAIIFSMTATTEGKSVLASTSTSNFFVMGQEMVKSAEILGKYIKEQDLCKSVAIISEQTDTGKDKIKGLTSQIDSEKVAIIEFFDPAATDFKASILKLKDKNADCLFVEVKSNLLPVLLKQLAENKYIPQIFSTSYAVVPGIVKDLPKEIVSKIIFSSTLIDEKNPLIRVFLDKYSSRYGKEATDFSMTGYEMVKIISRAVNKCGDDKVCIKSELNKINNLDTILGKVNIGQNQEIQLKGYRLFKVSNDLFVPVN